MPYTIIETQKSIVPKEWEHLKTISHTHTKIKSPLIKRTATGRNWWHNQMCVLIIQQVLPHSPLFYRNWSCATARPFCVGLCVELPVRTFDYVIGHGQLRYVDYVVHIICICAWEFWFKRSHMYDFIVSVFLTKSPRFLSSHRVLVVLYKNRACTEWPQENNQSFLLQKHSHPPFLLRGITHVLQASGPHSQLRINPQRHTPSQACNLFPSFCSLQDVPTTRQQR